MTRLAIGLSTVLLLGCDSPPLAELTRGDDRPLHVALTLRAAECEGNVAMLGIFELSRIRKGLSLAGVVVTDDDGRASALVRRELRADDVPAEVLRTSAATRHTLDSLTRGLGPALVVVNRRREVVRILRAPQSPSQLLALQDTLAALAALAAPAAGGHSR